MTLSSLRFVLELPLPVDSMFFTDYEGKFNLTADIRKAKRFNTRFEAEQYQWLLIRHNSPKKNQKHKKMLRDFKVKEYAFDESGAV